MEQVKKHWPQIAVGVAAVAISLYVYKRQLDSQKVKVDTKQDIKQQIKNLDGKSWPSFRRIVDCDANIAAQKNQLETWMQKILQAYMKKHGSFKVDESHNLNEIDFTQTYELIESVSRLELFELRKNNEKKRHDLFQKSFSEGAGTDEERQESRQKYIESVWADIQQEIENYKRVYEQILKRVKINDNVWNNSMDAYLPAGEQYIRKALRFSLSSPFTFSGKQSDVEILQIYQEASDFAIKCLTHKDDTKANFKNILVNALGEDEQDQLIILDYLIIDYVNDKYKLSSAQFKSAISAYELQDSDVVQGQIQKVVNALK